MQTSKQTLFSGHAASTPRLGLLAGIGALTLTSMTALMGAQASKASASPILVSSTNTAVALPPLQPTPASSLPVRPFIDETYLLGPGDIVAISVYNVPELSGEQQVLINGSLNLPMAGPLTVAGMTLEQAEAALAIHLQSTLRYPAISVTLLQPRPIRVAITGEIEQPGMYTLPVETGGQFPGIFQALQQAGGVTQAANLQQIEIRRAEENETRTVVQTDLWELIYNGDLSQDISLRDGDEIVVLATEDINIGQTSILAQSNLSAPSDQPISISVVGEVSRPGPYTFESNQEISSVRPTLTQAIRLAGGLEPLADLRNIQVLRNTRRGDILSLQVSLWELVQTGDINQDLILQSGDTIAIGRATAPTPEEITELASTTLAPDSIQINVVGEVDAPGGVNVSANTTLNQAILAAGGFNSRARRRVDLLRLNPDGAVIQQTVEVDLTQGLNFEGNPILMNNDVIVVHPTGAANLADNIATLVSPFLRILPVNFEGWNGLGSLF